MFIILQLIYFLLYNFPFQLCINLSGYLIYNRSRFLCNFHFLMWLLLQMPCLVIGTFIFRVLDCHYQLMDLGQVLCVRLITLQEIQVVAMMLRRMVFQLSGKVVALHLDNSTVKVMQSGWCSISFSFQTDLLNVESDQQAWYYSYSSIHCYLSQCGSQLSVTGMVVSGVTSSTLHCPSKVLTLGSTRGGSVGILIYHSMSALFHLGKCTTCGGHGIECTQKFLDISGKFCLSCSFTSSSSSFQASGETCYRSIQTFDSSGTLLDGGSLASHSSQYVKDIT